MTNYKNEQERYWAELDVFAARLTMTAFVVPVGLAVAMMALTTVVSTVVVIPLVVSVASFYAAGFAYYFGSAEWLSLLLPSGVVAAIVAAVCAYMSPIEAIETISRAL